MMDRSQPHFGDVLNILASNDNAFMLDWIVLFLVFAPPRFAIMVIAGSWLLDEDSSNVLSSALGGISVTLPSFLSFVVCDHWLGGRTLGKRIMGLSVESVAQCARRATRYAHPQLFPWNTAG